MEPVMINEVENKPMGFGKRLINIIFEPNAVFESIKSKKMIWIQLAFILGCLVLLAIPKAPLAEDYSRQTYEKMFKSEKFMKTQSMTTETANKYIEKQMQSVKIQAYLGSILSPFIYLLVGAGIFHGVFKLLSGVGSFGQTFSVMIYTYFIALIGEAVRTVNVVMSGDYVLTNSLALLLPNDKTSFIYNLLYNLDIFSIWYIILVSIGLSIVHNVSRKKSYISVIGLWGAGVLVSAIIATVGAVALYSQFGITI